MKIVYVFFLLIVISNAAPSIERNGCSTKSKTCCCKNKQEIYDLKNRILRDMIDLRETIAKFSKTTEEIKTQISIDELLFQDLNNTFYTNKEEVLLRLNKDELDIQNINRTLNVFIQQLQEDEINLQNVNNTLNTFIQQITLRVAADELGLATLTSTYNAGMLNSTVNIDNLYVLISILDATTNNLQYQLTALNSTLFNITQYLQDQITQNHQDIQNVNSTSIACCAANTATLVNYKASINAIISHANAAINEVNAIDNILAYQICQTQSICTLTYPNIAVFGGDLISNTFTSLVNGDIAVQTYAFEPYLFADLGTLIYTGVFHPYNSFIYGDLANFYYCTSPTAKSCNSNFGGAFILGGPFGYTNRPLFGVTLAPGYYCGNGDPVLNIFTVGGDIVLDGLGLPSPTWIFQISGSLLFLATVKVTVINTANPCNVIWNVGYGQPLPASAFGVRLDITAYVEGSIFSYWGTTLSAGSVVTGNVIDFNSVTLSNARVNTRACLGRNTCSGLNPPSVSTIPGSYVIP